MADQKHLVIIDGYSLLFRAFYGTRFLSTSDGRPTNALFGFVSMLFQLLENHQPDSIVVALDAPGKTFRHAEFPEYKGTRSEIPLELIDQLNDSRELIQAFNIPCIEIQGYEADDVVGTIAKQAESNHYRTTIVTGDLDSLQLVDDHVSVMTTKKGVTDVYIYHPAEVVQRYDFGPEFITDYKALVGDTSDNIPGVAGIGDKTARILINDFGHIENLIDHLDEVPEKFRKKLVGQEEVMKQCKWLATIVRDAPVEYNFEPYKLDEEHIETAKELMTRYEFRNHIKRFDVVLQPYSDSLVSTDAVVATQQLEYKFIEGSQTFDQLVGWISDKPFSIHPPSAPEQGSLLDDEPTEGLGYISNGKEVRQASWATLTSLFLKHPELGVAADTKKVYKEDPFQTLFAPLFDVNLAAYVLQSARSSYDLPDIAQGYLDIQAPTKPEDQVASLLLLKEVMSDRLDKENQSHILNDIELPLVPILAEMEGHGIKLSPEYLNEYSKELEVKVSQVQQHIWEIAGEEFNVGSPKQIGTILFDKMALPGGKKTKTGWATGVEILGELAGEHEIASEILAFRELSKLKSTYADALPKLIQSDGRIHTTFNQTVAATGRLSSIDPNLQNIPIRTELGRKIRKAFMSAEGYILGSFDYSQIELRILAHMCQEENLVTAFQERRDVHTATAALMYDITEEEVNRTQRNQAKLLNYAVLYGVTGFGLANQLGSDFSVADANKLIKQYNERFPSVKEFTEGMVAEARSKGYTATIDGRRRYFPDIHAGNRITRAYAERQAMNAPIQGTAADMIKIAMIQVRKQLGKSPHKMLLQVHDELVFELSEQGANMTEEIRKLMEDAVPLSVPIEVDYKNGIDWLDMKVQPRN